MKPWWPDVDDGVALTELTELSEPSAFTEPTRRATGPLARTGMAFG